MVEVQKAAVGKVYSVNSSDISTYLFTYQWYNYLVIDL